MIRASSDEANLLLTDWKEEGVWIGVAAFLGEDSKEEHKFLAKVLTPEPNLTLAGNHAVVEIPLDANTVFEYSEVAEAPSDLRTRFAGFEFCFMIRSQSVLALLFGAKPKNE